MVMEHFLKSNSNLTAVFVLTKSSLPMGAANLIRIGRKIGSLVSWYLGFVILDDKTLGFLLFVSQPLRCRHEIGDGFGQSVAAFCIYTYICICVFTFPYYIDIFETNIGAIRRE